VLAVAVGLMLAAGAPTAAAHVEPTPTKVKAGSRATIGFQIPHGCAGSPTTKLAVRLPTGLSDVTPVAKTGWTATVANGVLVFTGGPLPATKKSIFSFIATFPNTIGARSFPTVQTCVKGQTAWIQPSPGGQPEPEFPAPVVKVVP
jgi:periplasmic copper chaperone A